MCIGSDCFKIDIGSGGATQTYNGQTTIASYVDGTKYQTVENAVSTYDKDALRMGNWMNDKDGKWIHKTNGCTSGGQTRTAGCIGVPCDKWIKMTKQVGRTLTVCGARPSKPADWEAPEWGKASQAKAKARLKALWARTPGHSDSGTHQKGRD